MEIVNSDACSQPAGLGVGPCLHGASGKDGCAAVFVLQARPVACQQQFAGRFRRARGGAASCGTAALRLASIGWRNGG